MSSPRSTLTLLLVGAATPLLGACDLDVEGAFQAYCVANPSACDGGTRDASSADDGGRSDAGSADAGSADAGSADAGAADAGSADAGSADAGTADAGSADAGSADAGSADAGAADAGAADAAVLDAGGAIDAGLPLSAWCDAVAQARCERAVRCAASQSATCAAIARSTCERNELRRARAGSLAYDPFAAQRCVLRAAALPCGNASDACPDVLVPNAALGQRCEDSDCTAGFCPYVARNTPTLDCPRCTPYLDAGESCVATSGPVRPCPQGTWCDGTTCVPLRADGVSCTVNGDCLSGRCVDHAPLDGGVRRCGALPLGVSCLDTPSCGPNAYCAGLRLTSSGGLQNAGTCRVRRGLGQPCPDEQEEEGCVAGTCLSSTCQAPEATQATAAPCDLSTQCAVGRCTREDWLPGGAPWVGDGVCTVAAVGEACAVSSDCVPGAFCAADGGCARPVDAGAPCEVGGCGVLVCLAVVDGGRVCGLPASQGESCTTLPCDNSTVCLTQDGGARVCGLVPNGATCAGPPRCESFRCANDGGGSTCAASCF